MLVGLTMMKLSAWLPVVALTLTTGSRQASGTNSRSVGFGARSYGFMHLRVPSGTSMPLVACSICACKMDVAGVSERENGGKDSQAEACVHMCVLIDAMSKSGLKRRQKRRDSSTISQRMSSLILNAKIWRQAVCELAKD